LIKGGMRMEGKEIFKYYADKAHENSKKHGFYDEGRGENIPEKLMLIVSELAEALEAYRKDKHADYDTFIKLAYLKDTKEFKNHRRNDTLHVEYIKDTFEDEIADTFIRLFDLCGFLKIDIIKFIDVKMHVNKFRGYLHGNKKC
jgi:NTP pyrophosphatase (non-canonical NTP hydrolase)